jgi:hypothetical protein
MRATRFNSMKAGFAGVVAVYGVMCAASPGTYRFLDYVNLVFHEAGHVFFGFLGEFIGILGGSLMQVLVPAIVVGHFVWQGYRYSAAIALFWVGQSLFNVSVYVKDARARVLPLLGDDISAHDWYNILGRLGLLRWDQAVGNLVYGMGLVVVAVSVIGAFYFSLEEPAGAE